MFTISLHIYIYFFYRYKIWLLYVIIIGKVNTSYLAWLVCNFVTVTLFFRSIMSVIPAFNISRLKKTNTNHIFLTKNHLLFGGNMWNEVSLGTGTVSVEKGSFWISRITLETHSFVNEHWLIVSVVWFVDGDTCLVACCMLNAQTNHPVNVCVCMCAPHTVADEINLTQCTENHPGKHDYLHTHFFSTLHDCYIPVCSSSVFHHWLLS